MDNKIKEDEPMLSVADITSFLSEYFGLYVRDIHGNIINVQERWDLFLRKKSDNEMPKK